jgi:Ca2+-binding EF-hand superfamily protein
MTNGSHEEYLLRKIFNDFDINKSGYLSIDELYAMLIKLEIPVSKKYLSALFKRFDTNKSGVIEFEEFLNYLINNPYP